MRISDWSSDVCSSDLAAINASLTAAEEPSKMIARAKRGGDTSLGEVVSDIALSAGVGAVGGAFFKGTEKAGRAILSRVRTPAGELADKRSEEHTSELQSLMRISYAVFCLKKNIKLIQQKTRQIT